jgi:uncharacterized membrane protein YqjE
VRLLWSLPKAAPALLRHIAAYFELAALDLARAQHEFTAQLIASVIVAISALFAVCMACLGVIAYTWDTPYRLAAIGWLFAGFALLAIIAVLYRKNLARGRTPLMQDLQRQWAEDRVILERVLASGEEPSR